MQTKVNKKRNVKFFFLFVEQDLFLEKIWLKNYSFLGFSSRYSCQDRYNKSLTFNGKKRPLKNFLLIHIFISIYLNFLLLLLIIMLGYYCLYLFYGERQKNIVINSILIYNLRQLNGPYKSPPNNFYASERRQRGSKKRTQKTERRSCYKESEVEYLFGRGVLARGGEGGGSLSKSGRSFRSIWRVRDR